MLDAHNRSSHSQSGEYEGAKGQVELTIQTNTEEKSAIYPCPVNVHRFEHQKPTLPTTVT